MISGLRRAAIGLGAVLAVLASERLLAQLRVTQTPATGTSLVLGQVVDATTARGVPGVLVVLAPAGVPAAPIGELTEARAPAAPAPTTPGARRTLTAADGRFVFRDLPKGRFSISATAPAFVVGAYGQLRPLGPGQSLDLDDNDKLGGVTIKLWRNGSISGVVRDESGEPAVGVNVECLRRVFTGGQRRFGGTTTATTTAVTDDRGIYRVGNIPPGDYLCGNVLNPVTLSESVAAASAASNQAGTPTDEYRRMTNSAAATSATGARLGDLIYSAGAGSTRGPIAPPPDANGRIMAYAPQYYSGSTTTAEASLIAVKPGEDRSGIDIQLKLVPTARIGGKLMGPDGPTGFLGLTLVPASGNDVASEGQAAFARTTSDASGAFTLLGIPSGDYVLKGRYYPRPPVGGNLAAALDEATLWIAAPITVGTADVTNLTLTVRAGLRATGRVEFIGARTPPTAAEIQRIGVRLQMAEGRTSSPIALDGRVMADSTFKTSGYQAGRYIANVLPDTVPAGWFVKSIIANGRDVSVEPLDLTDADADGLLVIFTDTTTTLSGAVAGANGPDSTAEVVVFPADSMAWKEIGVVSRRGRVERVTKAGTFSITGLPPGDYFVAAAAGSLPGDRQDPALLSILMRDAQRVTLGDGGSATVQLVVKR